MKHSTEHDEQVAVIDWIFTQLQKYPELDLVFAVPNGARLASGRDRRLAAIRANMLKAEGMRPGTPDLVIPSPRGGYFGMFLEMKAVGGVVSENQSQFMAQAEKYGYFCAVAEGADAAIEILEWYLDMPYTQATL
jgi:hypothetical protein